MSVSSPKLKGGPVTFFLFHSIDLDGSLGTFSYHPEISCWSSGLVPFYISIFFSFAVSKTGTTSLDYYYIVGKHVYECGCLKCI